jgi:hypothetical protein
MERGRRLRTRQGNTADSADSDARARIRERILGFGRPSTGVAEPDTGVAQFPSNSRMMVLPNSAYLNTRRVGTPVAPTQSLLPVLSSPRQQISQSLSPRPQPNTRIRDTVFTRESSNDNRLPRDYIDLSESNESVSLLVNSPEDIRPTKLEEDSDEYKEITVGSDSLGDEHIKENHDKNCKNKEDWMKMHCTSCQSAITLEPFESMKEIKSFKIYNESNKKFGKGQCMLESDLRDILKSGESNVFSIWKGGEASGVGGKPTDKVVVKLYTGAMSIYITLESAYKIFHSNEQVFYALPLYGGKRRRIGNLHGRIGMSENHGQVPGYQVYKLLTKGEVKAKAKGVDTNKDYNLDFLACGKMGELLGMFMDTTLVREYLMKEIIKYILE